VDPGRITVADMDELVAAGEARALLPEFDVGPTWYDRMWWVIPQGPGEAERSYLVDDDDQVELTALFLTLERSAEVVAEIAEQRRSEQDRGHADDPASPYERAGARRRWWRR
jgi:hypothetical protein